MPTPRPLRPSVAARLDRQDSRLDRLESALAALQSGTAAISTVAGAPSELPLPPSMPLTPFLAWAKLTRRQYYGLRDRGVVRSIIVGERAVHVIPSSYVEYIASLDATQNDPAAPPRPPVNPPPGRWGRRDELGSLDNAVPRPPP